MEQYHDQKHILKSKVQRAKSKIHISCDLWTSPNSLAILGIIAHFIDENGKLQKCVLALKDIIGDHSGENLSKAVLMVVQEWGITSNLGFFVMDNASNNDTMMRALQQELLRQYKIKYDAKSHRLRCFGHIINLAVQSFLFVKDTEFIKDCEQTSLQYDVTLEEIEQWRKKGPLGKLHNFVVYIQGSVQREQHFWDFSGGASLSRDNATRWNSWYMMLYCAINLREAIEQYCEAYPNAQYKDDILSSDEWDLLEKIKAFLEKIKMATKAFESSNNCLDNILPGMDYILGRFEAGKAENEDDAFLAPMFNSGWSKFNDYYSLTDESCAYTIALVLNPKRKWKYIERKWPKSWHKKAKDMVKKVWEDEYWKETTPAPIIQQTLKPKNDFWAEMEAADALDFDLVDEYKQYCASPIINIDDAIAWWLEPTQQKTFPNLSKMALDYLSIPAMSAEPERLFSSAKVTISDRRSRLGSDIIEALECLQ